MGKIFTELKPMGLSGLDEDDKTLFDNGRTSHLNMVSESEKKEQEKQAGKEFEKDSLFDKKYECPICDYKFTQRTVRTGRTRLLSTDTDLRHKFRYFDPIKYDIIACPKCGYAALGQKSFIGISSLQRKFLKEEVQANFKGLPPMGEIYTYDDAILLYKLALYSSVVKKSRVSERAYICLKIAWLFRGKREDMNPLEEGFEEKQANCLQEENDYLAKAYSGFDAAVQSEMFPICGMDEMTFNYLYADLSRRLGNIDMAKKMIGTILVSKTATSTLKDRARTLKELLMEGSKEGGKDE
ncbi:MAG: DUF2225 domain-containing protein [Lachnospiraceae bacterium]|nr:DUF2225 domain-containing protein [Lachnospiraceae bacterium]